MSVHATDMAQNPVVLMPHQEEGIQFLHTHRSALLAFEQGLGKTLVAIETFRRIEAEGHVDMMLVLCPNSLKRNWVSELGRFAPQFQAVIIEGTPQVRRRLLSETRAQAVIISYETARAEVTAILALLGSRRAALVLDESHAIKNRRSITATAAMHFAPHAGYRWLLSGTPITNSPLDLYTQIGMVTLQNPLGSYAAFAVDYADAPSQALLDALAARIAPYLLRRTKAECLDLPEKTYVDLRVELPTWQRALYDQMRDELVCQIKAMDGREYTAFASTVLTQLLRLAQLASNPRLVLPGETRESAKQSELGILLDELLGTATNKVIIWSHYVGTIEMMIERFAPWGLVALYGGTEAADRQAIAKRFQEDPAVRVLVANPAAAGTGFTLTAATYTIYETLSWRYDFYAQSQDRNHRIGQRSKVTYIRLLAADTIDEVIADALEWKGQVAHSILRDAGNGPSISDLNRHELCELLMTNRLVNPKKRADQPS